MMNSNEQFFPLSPARLYELGVFNNGSALAEAFDKELDWVNHYLMWATWGANVSEAKIPYGYLRLERKKLTENDFVLLVEQTYMTHERSIYELKADIVCKNNEIATPISWNQSIKIYDDKRMLKKEISGIESASIIEKKINYINNGIEYSRYYKGAITDFWCLLAAMQNKKAKKNLSGVFTMLEQLTFHRNNQRLIYKDKINVNFGENKINLHCYHQIGEGVLPWSYWLNEDNRLLFAISGNLAYILDDKAKEKFESMKSGRVM